MEIKVPTPIKSRPYYGAQAMQAPNRYRKLIKAAVESEGFRASDGVALLMVGPIAEALEMQKADWPEHASRALGMEPDFDSNLTDVVLLWDGIAPLTASGNVVRFPGLKP